MEKKSVQATQAQCDSACCIMLRNRQMAVNIKDFYGNFPNKSFI